MNLFTNLGRLGILKPLPRLIIRPAMRPAAFWPDWFVGLIAEVVVVDLALIDVFTASESSLAFFAATVISFLFSFCNRFIFCCCLLCSEVGDSNFCCLANTVVVFFTVLFDSIDDDSTTDFFVRGAALLITLGLTARRFTLPPPPVVDFSSSWSSSACCCGIFWWLLSLLCSSLLSSSSLLTSSLSYRLLIKLFDGEFSTLLVDFKFQKKNIFLALLFHFLFALNFKLSIIFKCELNLWCCWLFF